MSAYESLASIAVLTSLHKNNDIIRCSNEDEYSPGSSGDRLRVFVSLLPKFSCSVIPYRAS